MTDSAGGRASRQEDIHRIREEAENRKGGQHLQGHSHSLSGGDTRIFRDSLAVRMFYRLVVGKIQWVLRVPGLAVNTRYAFFLQGFLRFTLGCAGPR